MRNRSALQAEQTSLLSKYRLTCRLSPGKCSDTAGLTPAHQLTEAGISLVYSKLLLPPALLGMPSQQTGYGFLICFPLELNPCSQPTSALTWTPKLHTWEVTQNLDATTCLTSSTASVQTLLLQCHKNKSLHLPSPYSVPVLVHACYVRYVVWSWDTMGCYYYFHATVENLKS